MKRKVVLFFAVKDNVFWKWKIKTSNDFVIQFADNCITVILFYDKSSLIERAFRKYYSSKHVECISKEFSFNNDGKKKGTFFFSLFFFFFASVELN